MTNKLFGTDGIRGKAGVFPMDVDFLVVLAKVLSKIGIKENKKIAIGKDTRISAGMIESALSAGFLQSGVDVISLGVIPTPCMTSMIESLNVDMGIMITASHNPYFDNGIKLINNNGDKFSDEFYALIEKELDNHEANTVSGNIGKIIKNESIVEQYIEKIRNCSAIIQLLWLLLFLALFAASFYFGGVI